jgi:hypothetical protein
MNVLEMRIATVNGGLSSYFVDLIVKIFYKQESCSGGGMDNYPCKISPYSCYYYGKIFK